MMYLSSEHVILYVKLHGYNSNAADNMKTRGTDVSAKQWPYNLIFI